MCEYQPGELILACHEKDTWAGSLIDDIRKGAIEHVEIASSLSQRLEVTGLPWNLYKLRVPKGDEIWKSNFLHNLYLFKQLHSEAWSPTLSTADLLQIVPNSHLSLEAFELGDTHLAFMRSFGEGQESAANIKVAIVDSGLEVGNHSAMRLDLWQAGGQAADNVGHGTSVASVISRTAPQAALRAIKVTDSSQLTEWDALAGLVAAADCDVINLSWSFGLNDDFCAYCGRRNGSARSCVFETVLKHTLLRPQQPIVVCAAGNQKLRELRYPARFHDTVAICATGRDRAPAPYSNRAADAAGEEPHPHVFFAPGGDWETPVGTRAAPFAKKKEYGTSMAAAYATGIIACARAARRGQSRSAVLEALGQAATPLPPPYAKVGNLIQRLR